MYFITIYKRDGDSNHVGPFNSRIEGIEWAQAQIKAHKEIYNGRWSNEIILSPTLASNDHGQPAHTRSGSLGQPTRGQ